MYTRNITIKREGEYWLIHIDGTEGITQAQQYDEVTTMAREYISLTDHVPISDIAIGTVTVLDQMVQQSG